jgi:hypothetical protein
MCAAPVPADAGHDAEAGCAGATAARQLVAPQPHPIGHGIAGDDLVDRSYFVRSRTKYLGLSSIGGW